VLSEAIEVPIAVNDDAEGSGIKVAGEDAHGPNPFPECPENALELRGVMALNGSATGCATGWSVNPPEQPALKGNDAWRYPWFSRELPDLGLIGRALTLYKEFEAHVLRDEE
jgi:hypothetical protein